MVKNNIGVLLVNIGTPSAPTPLAVKKYLTQFLSDPRVVEVPSLLWQPLLRGIILPLRSRQSAKLYQKIWQPEGSPLFTFSQKISKKLESHLRDKIAPSVHVGLGMHYSSPTIDEALESLRAKNCEHIIVLPLYPQYSATSTGSTFDRVFQALHNWRAVPKISFINDYADHPAYINAVCDTLKTINKQQHLLFSFHGIPQRYIDKGDPYAERCLLTTKLIAERLGLSPDNWSISFQSRLGRAKWLEPYTDKILQTLAKKTTSLSVVCPGFAADCLETLEEIAIRGKEQFLHAGGKQFSYIPALNDSDQHIKALAEIIKSTAF